MSFAARAVPLLLASGLLITSILVVRHQQPPQPAPAPLAAAAALVAHPDLPAGTESLLDALRADLLVHRQLIVLFAEEASLTGAARTQALAVGHRLHHERRELVHQVNAALQKVAKRPAPQRDPILHALLDWMDLGDDRLALDHLAFRDSLRIMQQALREDPTPQGRALLQRTATALAQVDRIEAKVEAEYRAVFGGPGLPARGGSRTLWLAYVAELQRRISLAQLLQSEAIPTLSDRLAGSGEINGTELPDKVLILSFDDGPHRLYTSEIKALLMKEHVPALFFEVGRNLGTVDPSGKVKLGTLAPLAGELVQAGFVLGNHSFTHAQLSKETGAPLDLEIRETDQLLQAIPGAHSHLFRFPFGARTQVQLEALRPFGLRSVLWNIDSLDWADPVPGSVADRVLKLIAHERRGILLFHDIHDRAGKLLPALIPRLRAEGYTFAGLDGEGRLVLPEKET